MSADITINEKQAEVLKAIVTAGKLSVNDKTLDGRSVRALSKRGLVKVNVMKTGDVVVPTAAGKKAFN